MLEASHMITDSRDDPCYPLLMFISTYIDGINANGLEVGGVSFTWQKRENLTDVFTWNSGNTAYVVSWLWNSSKHYSLEATKLNTRTI